MKDCYEYELDGGVIVAANYFGKRLQLNQVVYKLYRGYPEEGTKGVIVRFHRAFEDVRVSDNIVEVLWEGLKQPWDKCPIPAKCYHLETDEDRAISKHYKAQSILTELITQIRVLGETEDDALLTLSPQMHDEIAQEFIKLLKAQRS